MKTLTLYTLAQCDSCRRAVKWLREQGHSFEEKPIRETPPSHRELQRMLVARGGELRALFNTAGRDYREQKLSALLPGMSESAALGLLEANGNLVKRPFLIGDGVALVGFNPKVWTQHLAK